MYLSKPSEYGKRAIQDLCEALDDTFAVLRQLTDRAGAEVSNLQSLALPRNEKSLAYVQAILKHNFSPSKLANLANKLQRMQSEIQACSGKLESSFGHVSDLYAFSSNRLVRVSRPTSIFSTSTMLTAQIKLAGWLKQREGTWGLLKRNRPRELKLARPDVFSSDSDVRHQDFLRRDRVSGMPSDVLSKILHHLCTDGPLELRYVLSVSKRLYDAAVGDASLWTTISFDIVFFAYFKRRPLYQADRFIEQCLSRSASLPLSLSIRAPTRSDGAPLFFRHLSSFKYSKYKGFERCSSLVWSCSRKQYSPTNAHLLPEEFPSLQYMSLSGFDNSLVQSRFPNCPVLVKVEILDHYGHFVSWDTTFAHVTTLSFGNSYTSQWHNHDIWMLSLFPGLHDLTLFTLSKTSVSGAYHARPIQFQTLQILRAQGAVPSQVLTRVVAPALQELHIKADAENFTPITALSHASRFSFSHLYALLPEAVSMQEPAWVVGLSWLVRGCTKLETLHISKWMEAECKKFIDIGDSDIIFNVH